MLNNDDDDDDDDDNNNNNVSVYLWQDQSRILELILQSDSILRVNFI
jgi:hypothetical protein